MDFHPLSLEDKPRIDAALAADPPAVSELTFTNLWAWRRKRAVEVARAANHGLVFLCEEHGENFFLPPVAAVDPVGLAGRLVALARERDFPFAMRRVPAVLAHALAAAGFGAAADRDNFDYVYAVRDLAALEGRHFDGKRNQIKRLTRSRACAFQPLDDAAKEECLALAEVWCDFRACHLDEVLAAEQEAIGACLRSHRALELIGGVVRVDGALKAFALAERLDAATAVVHFEKADPAIPGLPQLINHWFCREALGAFTFVNREQDLGVPGLRQAKESWRPHHLVEKFVVSAPPRG